MNYKVNIIDTSHDNTFFRKVLLTGPHSQVVVMSLGQGEDIGLEKHTVDQILVFTQGHGQAIINGQKLDINPGDLFIVPAGTEHNFTNTGNQELKLFTVYAPPQHKQDTIHKTKAQAQASEEHY